MGLEIETGRILPHGALAATPMRLIRAEVLEAMVLAGLPAGPAGAALARAWHPPDPVTLARPLADLPALFARLAGRGCQVAVATSDDREPTLRTLEALGVAAMVGGVACADDGGPVKPAPDAALRLARALSVAPGRMAVIGDSPADLAMGRAAGAGRVIGVLTGVGDRSILAPLADLVLDSIADLAPGI
jgi:phosphoglycolate phosphatase